MSLYSVTSGNNTLAADLNQYHDLLTGAAVGGLVVNGGSNVNTPYIAQESALPSSLQAVVAGQLTTDTLFRIALTLRSDGYGGMYGGTNGSTTAHLFAGASGWNITESLSIGGTLSVAGASTFAGITNNGTFASDSGAIVTNGSGRMASNGNPHVVSNASGTTKIWVGTTDPGGAAAEGDLWADG